jgi:ABC-type arginine/histidine transport system permease subunit
MCIADQVPAMADSIVVASVVAGRSSGFGGVDLGAAVDTVVVGVIIAIALVYLLAWTNVATNRSEEPFVDNRRGPPLLAALAPLFLIFTGILTIRVLEVLG